MPTFDIVIPTIGRPTLGRLMRSLADQPDLDASSIIVVDDRPLLEAGRPLDVPLAVGAVPVIVVTSGARGPAAARNRGIESSTAEWVVFLDDDVVAPRGWAHWLVGDLRACRPGHAGSQARIEVTRTHPARRPTDWERNVGGLEDASWATADMAVRRSALLEVDGFDERFPRAFREDADLALRLLDAGHELVRGNRTMLHPVGPAGSAVSLRLQRGNMDDPLMAAVHGQDWRRRSGAVRGRRRRHVVTTLTALGALLALVTARPRTARLTGLAWSALTVELAWARIAPGPRSRREVTTMAWTSVLMPPVATWWWLLGVARARRIVGASAQPRLAPGSSVPASPTASTATLEHLR
ncbi:MAG: putative D,D-heptose 1,7-bisphosphate phosphatase [Thermoleophilia bacterium]|nr:putative D,D-heptose 1,7-bisphosphate phosphatase [Thermoleophilia bacterium]